MTVADLSLPPAPDALLPVIGEQSRPLLAALSCYARQQETILLSGASGTGKSRLAQWCHQRSPRQRGPFQVVDLLSVPEEMQMAELFGWRRGAFTGAATDQEGCIARAENGTLFLDEIDKLSLRAQAGLLLVLETRTFRVLGEPGRQQRAAVRFIVATNADLRALVAQGRFREDLYFRINVLPVKVLPLHERRDEILPWARFMLERCHREYGAPGAVAIAPTAEALILAAPWPGNLRQLDNVLRRAYALACLQGASVTVAGEHLQAALRCEDSAQALDLLQTLHRAADEIVGFACQCQAAGVPLGMDVTAALRGLVLRAGLSRLGDAREVFSLLGQERLVRSRNHGRSMRRELTKVTLLQAELSRLQAGLRERLRSPEGEGRGG